MSIRHKMKLLPAALFIIVLIAVFAPAVSADENSSTYPLTIDGENITRIVLINKVNKSYSFEDMNEPVMLPAGTYRLREVYLDGGFQSYRWSETGFEVGPDKEAVLKVGPPLTQSISITRQGSILQLDYRLTGQSGENYTLSDRSKAPEFAVFKNDKKIASGKFEYGWGSTCQYSWRVPVYIYGQLSFVASFDIGKYGQNQSQPVPYQWNFSYNMASFVPWALLVLAIILFKKNRTAKSLLILIPIAISCLVWLLFKLTFSVPSSQAAIFDMMLLSFVIGLAILCLWAHKRSRRNRFGTLLLAVAVVSIVSIVSSLPFYSFILSSEVIIWIIFLELVIFAAAAAVILTCFKCRKDYSPVRFVLWLALWSVISCLTVMFLYAGVIIMSGGIPTEQFLNLLKELFIVGLVIGALLYLIMLPFVIMLMNSGFFRWPFFECFRLKGMVLSPSERDRAGLPPQSQTPSAETNQSDDWRK